MAVVNYSGKKTYIGSSMTGDNERSQIQISFFHSVLDKKIKNARNVIVTCHAYADADAVAATLGVVELVKTYKKTVNHYIHTFDNTGKQAYDELGKHLHDFKITPAKLQKQISNNTLLIVVDTTDGDRLQFDAKTLSMFDPVNRLIIDHHRVSHAPLKTNIDAILLDTKSSSSSELVTQLINISVNGSEEEMKKKNIAQLLSLGIYIDTNGLTKNTASGTFNAIA
jgi:c-di-AMP phosphodiesterase-like protein